VVAANFLPRSAAELEVQLLTSQGKQLENRACRAADVFIAARPMIGVGNFWRVDFSEFRQPELIAWSHKGTVHEVSRLCSRSSPTSYWENGAECRRFFLHSRCGFAVPGWHKACHLDDANLPDGTHIDATGGWHSAGDYNKLMYENGDGGAVFALLTAQAAAPQIFTALNVTSNTWSDALDEAQWGAQFVARMQVPETGALRNHVNQGPGRNWTKWSPPQEHTDTKSERQTTLLSNRAKVVRH